MCDCRDEIEKKIVENYSIQHPEATEIKSSLKGYGFGMRGDRIIARPLMPFEITASLPLKKGGRKNKKISGSMFFSFCPFCGEKIMKEDAV